MCVASRLFASSFTPYNKVPLFVLHQRARSMHKHTQPVEGAMPRESPSATVDVGSTELETERNDFKSTTTKTEPTRTGPGRTEPNRAEPSRTELHQTENNRTKQNRKQPNRAKPNRPEPTRTETNRGVAGVRYLAKNDATLVVPDSVRGCQNPSH